MRDEKEEGREFGGEYVFGIVYICRKMIWYNLILCLDNLYNKKLKGIFDWNDGGMMIGRNRGMTCSFLDIIVYF